MRVGVQHTNAAGPKYIFAFLKHQLNSLGLLMSNLRPTLLRVEVGCMHRRFKSPFHFLINQNLKRWLQVAHARCWIAVPNCKHKGSAIEFSNTTPGACAKITCMRRKSGSFLDDRSRGHNDATFDVDAISYDGSIADQNMRSDS